jgi:hypothetical protein
MEDSWETDLENLTLKDFVCFFQFHAFDILSEKIDTLQDKKDVAYKKFVQMHREMQWAQNILHSVSKVGKIKGAYKKLLADLNRRNMQQLHHVCCNVVTSNTLPTRQSPTIQKCCVTGKWYEKCLDITKSATSSGGNGLEYGISNNNESMFPCVQEDGMKKSFQYHTSMGVASPCTQTAHDLQKMSLQSGHDENVQDTQDNQCASTIHSVGIIGPAARIKKCKSFRGRRSKQNPQFASSCVEKAAVHVQQQHPKLFISNQFQHFVHMLWTMAKLDLIVKNYTLSWFSKQGGLLMYQSSESKHRRKGLLSSMVASTSNPTAISKKRLLEIFCEDSKEFQEDFYVIFVHAVRHVHISLNHYLKCSLTFCDQHNTTCTENIPATDECSREGGEQCGGFHVKLERALQSLHAEQYDFTKNLEAERQPLKKVKASTLSLQAGTSQAATNDEKVMATVLRK